MLLVRRFLSFLDLGNLFLLIGLFVMFIVVVIVLLLFLCFVDFSDTRYPSFTYSQLRENSLEHQADYSSQVTK